MDRTFFKYMQNSDSICYSSVWNKNWLQYGQCLFHRKWCWRIRHTFWIRGLEQDWKYWQLEMEQHHGKVVALQTREEDAGGSFKPWNGKNKHCSGRLKQR